MQHDPKSKVAAKFSHEHVEAREKLVNGAVATGKIPRHRANHYRSGFDADPEGTRQVIASLAAVLPSDPNAEAVKKLPAYNPRWLSEIEHRKLEAGRRGERPRVEFGV